MIISSADSVFVIVTELWQCADSYYHDYLFVLTVLTLLIPMLFMLCYDTINFDCVIVMTVCFHS